MRLPWGIIVGGVAFGCDPAPERCVAVSPCTPQYGPTFDNVHTNTLATSCQLSGCHGDASDAGGLALGTGMDAAFSALLEDGWVIPGDAGCSPAFVEIAAGRMPPGAPLVEAEQCAVQQWIEQGASR